MLEVIETKKCKDCGEIKPVDQFHKDRFVITTKKQYYKSRCKVCRAKHRQTPEVKEKTREYKNTPEVREKKREYDRNHKHKQRAVRNSAPYSPDILSQYKETLGRLGGHCAYCGAELTPDTEHLEHIIPLSEGGTHTPDNIVCSCAKCNLSKNARPMEEWYREQPFFSEERLQQIYAIRDYWNAVGFEVVYPTEEKVNKAIQIAEGAIDTIQNLSRIQRDPHVIQEYI